MMQAMVIYMEEAARMKTWSRSRHIWTGQRRLPFEYPKWTGIGSLCACLNGLVCSSFTSRQGGVRYLKRMTLLSYQQVTRLVQQYRNDGKLMIRQGPNKRSALLMDFTQESNSSL